MAEGKDINPGSALGDFVEEFKKAPPAGKIAIIGVGVLIVGIAVYLHNKSKANTPAQAATPASMGTAGAGGIPPTYNPPASNGNPPGRPPASGTPIGQKKPPASSSPVARGRPIIAGPVRTVAPPSKQRVATQGQQKARAYQPPAQTKMTVLQTRAGQVYGVRVQPPQGSNQPIRSIHVQ